MNHDFYVMNNKKTLVNLYKDIVLVTRRTHFLYDIVYQQPKVVIEMHAFLMDQKKGTYSTIERKNPLYKKAPMRKRYYQMPIK